MTTNLQQQHGPLDGAAADWRGAFNLLRFAARAAALPVEVFVRRWGTWGDRHLGVEALAGLAWPLLFLGLYGPDPGLGAVADFWAVMAAALVLHRMAGLARRRRGAVVHSRFVGVSRFEGLPLVRTVQAAHGLEIAFALAAALLAFAAVSKPLGGLLLASAVGHAVTLCLAHQATDARLRAMRDAELEAGYYADLYRERFGGRR